MLSTHAEESNSSILENFFIEHGTEAFQYVENLVTGKGMKGLLGELGQLFERNIFLSADDLLHFSYKENKINEEFPHPVKKLSQSPPTPLAPKKTGHAIVKEENGEGMEYKEGVGFKNWSGSVRTTPAFTFFPKTKQGLQNLVLWAKKNNKRIRVSGYRHSFTEVYPDDGEVLASLIDGETATHLPAQYPEMNKHSDLQGIELVGEPFEKKGIKKIKCKIGAATCNYHLLDWIHDKNGGNSKWTLPSNVIMTEITLGGSNALLCHGGGVANKTLSDLVTEIEFVNANGELQVVNDPEQLKAAAGCLGLLGIVTSLTLVLDEMSYANLNTVEKQLLSLTIPPPLDYKPSKGILDNLDKENLRILNDKAMMMAAIETFYQKCLHSDYAEFFWFPGQKKKIWSNCWQTNGNKEEAERYPDTHKETVQKVGSYLAYLADTFVNDDLTLPSLRKLQTDVFGTVAMHMLPDKPNITCTKHDALHFQKGIQNIPTRMFELEIPLPDLAIAQKAVWSVFEIVYNEYNMEYFPMRTALEMRVMGGSDLYMAPQWGNEITCAIEVLTMPSVNYERWLVFLQEVLDKWSALKHEGHYLNIRPHWAKEFKELFINRPLDWLNDWSDEQKKQFEVFYKGKDKISLPIMEYLKHFAYKEQIPLFNAKYKEICKQGGYGWKEARARFSNAFLDDLMTVNHPSLRKNIKQKLSHARFFNCFNHRTHSKRDKDTIPELPKHMRNYF